MVNMVEDLNAQFALADQLYFQMGEGGLPIAQINNPLATAEVYLHGAHITAFRPRDHEQVLWMSSLAQFQPGKAIRGGVPVIWPWFGPHATDSSKPQHGFARTVEWRVSATKALADGSTQLQLQLTDNPSTRALWPHTFELSLTISVGSELKIDLTARNTGEQTFVASGAMHSYFAIGDVTQMHIEGLAGREYIDQLDGDQIKQQTGAVRITQETDRIYFNSEDACVIHDAMLSRQIHVKKSGSRSTVVWNPWKDKAQAISDFPNEGYQNMVCIEVANAADDVVQLAPGEEHTLSQIIAVLITL
jgi:D-hexose-6-phosphate mutarotase